MHTASAPSFSPWCLCPFLCPTSCSLTGQDRMVTWAPESNRDISLSLSLPEVPQYMHTGVHGLRPIWGQRSQLHSNYLSLKAAEVEGEGKGWVKGGQRERKSATSIFSFEWLVWIQSNTFQTFLLTWSYIPNSKVLIADTMYFNFRDSSLSSHNHIAFLLGCGACCSIVMRASFLFLPRGDWVTWVTSKESFGWLISILPLATQTH